MSTQSQSAAKHQAKFNVRNMTVTAVMGAISAVLIYLNFSVPLMPSFIKLDVSELPALITAFSLGPVSGVIVCFIKNVIKVMATETGGVGELSNFLLGVCFVVPAGVLYRLKRDRWGALIGSLIGAVTMAAVSIPINYYIIYPIYTAFMPMDVILGMYQAINPNTQNLWQALVTFNAPFTFIKGMLNVGISFLIYKRISMLIKGK